MRPKYLIRSVKYFVYLIVVLALIISILMFAGFIEKDISKVFVNGYDSLWQIAIIMAVFAGVYPLFGYGRKVAHIFSDPAKAKPIIAMVMEARGYKLKKEQNNILYYQKRAPLDRMIKVWEDTIEVCPGPGGWELEGHSKEIVRLASLIESRATSDYIND